MSETRILYMQVNGEHYFIHYPACDFARAVAAACRWTAEPELAFGRKALHVAGLELYRAAAGDGAIEGGGEVVHAEEELARRALAAGKLAECREELDACEPQRSWWQGVWDLFFGTRSK